MTTQNIALTTLKEDRRCNNLSVSLSSDRRTTCNTKLGMNVEKRTWHNDSAGKSRHRQQHHAQPSPPILILELFGGNYGAENALEYLYLNINLINELEQEVRHQRMKNQYSTVPLTSAEW